MAGDWIKMRSNLRRHPKVVRIASALNADRLRVVGGLHAVWCLFDEHSIDGQLCGYTPAAIDEEIGWTGFCDQLIAIHWVISDGSDGLELPEFDTHNGASAKRRAMESDRKRAERAASSDHPESVGNASASNADKKRTREEKRREEKKEESLPAVAEKKTTRKSQVPSDFHPDDAGIGAAESAGLDVKAEVRKFVDFHESKASTMANWQAAWRTWVGKAVEFGRGKPVKPSGEAAWLAGTPFTDTFEAHNAGCFSHNVAKFRTGATA